MFVFSLLALLFFSFFFLLLLFSYSVCAVFLYMAPCVPDTFVVDVGDILS